VRSLEHTEVLGPGFDPNNAVTMSVDLGLQGYDQKSGENFYQQLADHVRALPGVKSAGWIARLPLALDVSTTGVYPEGQAEPRAEEMPSAIYESVSPDYFATMGIPIVGGRDFAGSDTAKSPGVVIVNQTLAERFWPSQNAIGKRLHSGNTDVLEVVGVAQNYATSAALVIRTSVDPGAEISSVRGEVQTLDPQLPIYDAKTLKEHMRLALFPLHAGAVVAGSFALLAMILAAIGIYGVMAYSVSQRTHEIGIRMALGARASDVWKMVLKQGVIITVIGMVFGLVCAIGLSGVVASMLYGVSATDPLTFLFITLLLAAVALTACYIPARRATKVDPVIAIRSL
jgi:hypothetical protein